MKIVVLFFLIIGLHLVVHGQPTAGLTAHYSFNDGTATDLVSNTSATPVGSARAGEDRFGNANKSFYFVGKAGTYLNLGNNSGLKPSTGSVSVWFNVEDIVSDGFGEPYVPILVAKYVNKPYVDAYGIYLHMETNKLTVIQHGDLSADALRLTGKNELELQRWHHVVLTYTDNNLTVYLNDSKIGSLNKNFPTTFSSDPVTMGGHASSDNERILKGWVDDFRVYDRVLSASEVTELFLEPNPFTPVTIPIEGESPCAGKWALSSQNNSSLLLEPSGTLKKVSYSGNSKAESENELVAGEKGWMKFTVTDFGIKRNDKPGKIKIGAESGGKNYQFNIAEHKTTHWILVDGKATQSFQANFEQGSVIRIKRTKKHLILKQKLNGKQETVARIKNIGTDATKFFVKLNGLGATITKPRMSYSLGCPPYASLTHQLDGGYIQQTDEVLRIKFQQEYAVDPALQYTEVDYNIYDWRRTVVKNGKLKMYYGTNWKNIGIPNLAPATHYTLEFNANKEEQYLLRFKTK